MFVAFLALVGDLLVYFKFLVSGLSFSEKIEVLNGLSLVCLQ